MGELIKRALEANGMTQKELADRMFVSPQAVSKWINGESQPSTDNAKLIYEILGLNLINEKIKTINPISNQKMNIEKSISEINNIKKAEIEAASIIDFCGIESKYSHPISVLCKWLLSSVIGLTYHKFINHNEDDDICYNDIFYFLGEYLEEMIEFDKVQGLYENHLEYEFYQMGGDLFETFGEYELKNHEFCEDSMQLWHRFETSVIKSAASPIYNELLVAINEITSLI